MTFPEKDNGNEVLHTEVKGVKRLLMPLWFLTWRTQDRVAYAVVNGVTGKITADVPLDKKKCLAVSLAAAVPLFLIFYFLFPVFLPETQLAAVMLVMGITARIFRRWLKLFGEKETHEWDAGFQSRAQREKKVRSKERKAPVKGTVKLVLIFVGYFFVMLIFDLIVDGAFEAVPLLIGKIVEVVFGTSRYWMSVLGCFFTLLMVLTVRKVIAKTGRKSLWLQGGLAAAGMAVCVAILIWHPVEDFYYYIGMILLLGDILFLLVSLLEYYNQLSTRQLPDFHGRGERA